jgi:hypothetical protein
VFREPKRSLAPGDLVEIEIEGIGVLHNYVQPRLRVLQLEETNFGGIGVQEFYRLLAACRLGSPKPADRLAFNARSLVTRLGDLGDKYDDEAIVAALGRWARGVDGELLEGEVLWLPASELPQSLIRNRGAPGTA